jgi:hypothetical protein
MMAELFWAEKQGPDGKVHPALCRVMCCALLVDAECLRLMPLQMERSLDAATRDIAGEA